MAAKVLGTSGGKLAIFASPTIAEVFAMAGLDTVLEVHTEFEPAPRKALAE